MSEKKIYYGVDYCKLLCAVLIVFMHTVRGNSEFVYWVRDVLTTIAVPYFFIASGFFLGKGLSFSEQPLNYTKRYFVRLFALYTAWSILVIPVSLLCIEMRYPESSAFFRALYLIRMFFLSGSCGIYWYILALLINCWVLFLVYTRKVPMGLLGIISILSFMVGVMYSSQYFQDYFFFELIHIIFGSPRNFIHTGLIYMLIGFYFSFHEIKIRKSLLVLFFVLFLFLRLWECRYSDFQFVQLFLAIILFLVSIRVDLGDLKSSRWARRLSMALYLEHFPILLLIDYFYTICSFEIIFPMILLICVLLYLIMRVWLPNPIFKLFYGENK